jgi:hypothetical protein
VLLPLTDFLRVEHSGGDDCQEVLQRGDEESATRGAFGDCKGIRTFGSGDLRCCSGGRHLHGFSAQVRLPGGTVLPVVANL